jgi:hypothetical protein
MPSDEYTFHIKLWPTQVIRAGDGNIPYDSTGDRFGRCVKIYKFLGELRKQKKKPNKEVFYIWIESPAEKKYVLRSVVNCTNDQLVASIRRCGEYVEAHKVNRPEGEDVLDFLYAELGRRTEVVDHAQSLKNQDVSSAGNARRDPVDSVSNG